jgi:hypothetical protein
VGRTREDPEGGDQGRCFGTCSGRRPLRYSGAAMHVLGYIALAIVCLIIGALAL